MIEQEIRQQLKHWKKIIKPYQKPSNKKAVIQLLNTFLPFLALWTLMYFSLDWSYWITLGLAVVNAFLLARIFIIQHDCGHQSFLRSRLLNDVVGVVCSFFSTIPYKYWAAVHNFHHGHSGQLELRDIGDVPMLTVEEYRQRSWWGRLKYRIFRHPFVLFILVPIGYFAFPLRIPVIGVRSARKEYISMLKNNIWLVAVYVVLALLLGWKKFLMIQLPIVLLFMIIAFWFFFVQHQHEETYKRWKDNWDFLVASIRGSTYYKLPAVFNWLTGNIGFHHIHHLSARIPNYNLQRCARENPILQKYVTIMTFRDSLKCIFNKLWDEQQERMISFREFYLLEERGVLG